MKEIRKVVVLGGAGGMGSMAVKDLAIHDHFDEVVVADVNLLAAQQVVEAVNHSKVTAAQIDVTQHDQLTALLQGASIVINFVGPYYKFAPMIIRACMEVKVDYVDICDDYDAAERIIEMDEEVKKAGITVLTGMGTSPGITNILAKMGMDQLDSTEEIDMIWVMGDGETGTAILDHVFHSGTGIVPGYVDGKRIALEPFTEKGAQTVEFPQPLGQVTVYDIGHPEPVTIPYFYPEVKTVTNKGTLMPTKIVETFKMLFTLGFGAKEEMTIKGVNVSPRDFAIQYLQEHPHLLAMDEPFGFGGLKVIVKGMKNGKKVGFVYTTVSSETTAESVAIPAVVGAELITSGSVTTLGVIAPEVLQPSDVFHALGTRKRVGKPAVNSGLMIEMIHEDGSIETIRSGRAIQ